MKKFFLLSALLQWAVMVPVFSMEHDEHPIVKDIKTGTIKSITINADVTVVLMNSGQESIRISGDADFMHQVTLKQTGNRLVINAARNASLIENGIIYIPASSLDQIQINSAALLKSAGPLEIPKLDIRINGECKIHIIHIGQLNLIGNDYYDYTRDSKEILVPSQLLRTKKD